MATKTTDVIATRQDDELIMAGETVDLRFVDRKGKAVSGLSLVSAKLLHELVNHAGPAITKSGQRFKIDLAAVNWSHRSGEEIEAAALELALTGICVDMIIRDKPARRWGAFLSDVIRYDERTQILEYEFTPLIRTIFMISKHWASLSAQAVYAFESAYALRLYELITLRQGRRQFQETFTLDELRERLGVPPNKLDRFHDLKRFVLDRAIEEVNYLSGAVVEYELVKRKRKVQAVTLRWRVKHGLELDETASRLKKTRTERRSERKTVIERLEDETRKRRAKLADDLLRLNQAQQINMELDDQIPE